MTVNEEKAVVALATSKSQEEAARKCGLSARTLRHYLQREEFQKAYRAACLELTAGATNRARQLLSPALDTLDEVMNDANAPPAARTNAARIAIEAGLKLTEQNDILRKIERLEALIGEQQH